MGIPRDDYDGSEYSAANFKSAGAEIKERPRQFLNAESVSKMDRTAVARQSTAKFSVSVAKILAEGADFSCGTHADSAGVGNSVFIYISLLNISRGQVKQSIWG